MPAPTRQQIEATVTLPHYLIEIFYEGGLIFPDQKEWIALEQDQVIDVSGVIETTGNQDNGLAFGTTVEPAATIIVKRYVVQGIYVSRDITDSYWLLKKIRIYYAFDNSDYVLAFQGVIKDRTITNDEVTINLGSNFEYLRNKKYYSDLFENVPIATKTNQISKEDPSDPNYAAGIINNLLWVSGGRPKEQEGNPYDDEDDDFKFWYRCDQAILTPDW